MMKKGDLFGHYRIDECIDSNGVIETYRVFWDDDGSPKTSCLKVLLSDHCEDDTPQGFIDGARRWEGLQHENIVCVNEVGKEDGVPFLTMEYVEGTNLGRLMRSMKSANQRLGITQCVQIAIDICAGLHFAASHDLFHHCISPWDILLSQRGAVKIGGHMEAFLTHHRLLNAKISYMSPEYALGNPVEHWADQFGVGVILWEMLTDTRFLTGESDLQRLQMLVDAKFERPSRRRSDIPKELDDILMKALSKEPSDRFQDTQALGLALTRFRSSFTKHPSECDLRSLIHSHVM